MALFTYYSFPAVFTITIYVNISNKYITSDCYRPRPIPTNNDTISFPYTKNISDSESKSAYFIAPRIRMLLTAGSPLRLRTRQIAAAAISP